MESESCENFSLSHHAGHILHNLSICCNCTDDLKDDEKSLLTFAVQLTRAFVTSVLLILLLLCYSTLRVLGRTIVNCAATCVIPWIIFFGLYVLKSLTLITFIVIMHYQDLNVIDRVGFILINCLQPIILMTNCLALNHEWHYRSPDYVDNPVIATDEGSWILKLRHFVCRISTIFVCQTVVTLALLIAVEVQFETPHGLGTPIWLVYVWLIAMLVQRVTVCVMGIMVCIQHHNQPTIKAKIILLLGLFFLIGDDLPNSLLATGDFCTKSVYDTDPCYLTGLGVYDMLQMMGLIGTVLILLFIRDQYVRVEEECKHHLLWDLERLLDVNTQERNDLLIK